MTITITITMTITITVNITITIRGKGHKHNHSLVYEAPRPLTPNHTESINLKGPQRIHTLIRNPTTEDDRKLVAAVRSNTWVVVNIRVPFGVLIIIRHLFFRVPKKGP